jgi:hypothetical protein
VVSLECRIGHRYGPDAFLEAQAARVEDALWTATNVLHERAATLRHLSQRLRPVGRRSDAFETRAREMDDHAAIIRQLITQLMQTEDSEEDFTPSAPSSARTEEMDSHSPSE